MGRTPAEKYKEAFQQGPNDLAKKLKASIMNPTKQREVNSTNPQDQEIIMWVPEAIISEIKDQRLLDPSITLKPVESIYKRDGFLIKKERENLEKTVSLLGEYNAYSAQKDILSAAILEKYGGYYLDTTTKIDSIDRLIHEQPKDIWFPRIGPEDAEAAVYNGEPVVLPDVWALYNPTPGGGTFKTMLNSYVQRCKFYFPDSFLPDTFDWANAKIGLDDFKTGYNHRDAYGQGNAMMSDKRGGRELLIGELVISSFQEALDLTKGPISDFDSMKEISSFAENEDGCKLIKELGITKFHRGLWREALLEEVVGAGVTARPEKEQALNPNTKSNHTDRLHLFPAKENMVQNFKVRLELLKGDSLKEAIIDQFTKDIDEIQDEVKLGNFVDDFRKTHSYQVLATPQGLMSRVFSKAADSVSRIDCIIAEKEKKIGKKNGTVSCGSEP